MAFSSLVTSINSAKLSHAEREFHKHADTNDLQRVLEEVEKHHPPCRRIVTITDGVFSMDGDIAPLDQIRAWGGRAG